MAYWVAVGSRHFWIPLLLAACATSCTRLDDLTAPSCTFALSSGSATFDSRGGTGTVAVHAANSCAWTVTTKDAWVALPSTTSGSGDASISYAVAANAGTALRRATLKVADQSFTVSQSGSAASCTYAASPTTAAFPGAGGSDTVTVTTQEGCPWTATSPENFVTITSGSSAGSGVVNYAVAANPSNNDRGGTMTVAGRIVTILQAGKICTFGVSPTSATFGIEGGSGIITVTTQSGCTWSATSEAGWIAITPGASGSGNGTVSFVVELNTAFINRVGTIFVAGQTVTISQVPVTEIR